MAEEILIKFLLIITLLFFVPKVVFRARRIPYPITEVILGIILGVGLPLYFFLDDTVRLLATLGVITIFINAGMEVDSEFIKKNKRVVTENMIIQTVMVVAIGAAISLLLALTLQQALLVSLALLTPSASFIFSFLRSSHVGGKEKSWIESKVLGNEILGIFLLLVFLNLGSVENILLRLVVIGLLVLVLPHVFDILYRKVFGKLIGIEFTFIFVVALISAYATELLGVHFLIGAFVAGVVAKKFLEDIKLKKFITHYKQKQITEGFVFFALVFSPFYFFSVGLMVDGTLLNIKILSIALIFLICATVVRMVAVLAYRRRKINESYEASFTIASMLIPTLLFTFVIAEILRETFAVSDELFGALLIYGILSSLVPVVLLRKRASKK